MKIVQVVDSLDLGGTERMSVNIANSLADHGIESHLLVTRKLGGLVNYVLPSVNLKTFHKRNAVDLVAFFRLLFYLRAIKADFLHVHQTSIYWVIALKPFLGKTQIIWHDHFGQSEMLNQFPRKGMDFIFPYLSAVITVNTKLKDYWIQKFPEKSNKIYFIPNFPQLIEIEREIDPKEFSIVNVANFRKQKDQITLIEALVFLKLSGYEFKAYLIGEIVDTNWLEEIKAVISKHDLFGQVEIVGPVNDISSYLKIASIGVLSSESEGLPVALLEYGMAALPTVSTRVGQCGEVLGDGQFGWLVPVKAPDEMALAMKEILDNPSKARKFGELFKENVRNNYGQKNFLNQYLQVIREISSTPNKSTI